MEESKLKMLWAARTKYLRNWGIRSHRHNCYQVFYITAGNCRFIVNGEDIELDQNRYLIVLPGEEHSMQKDHESVVRMIDIKLEIQDAVLAKKVARIKKSAEAFEQVSYLFKMISSELKSTGNHHKDIIEAYLYIVLLKMIPSSGGQAGALIITGIDDSLWPPFCKKIANYIKENFASKLDLEDVAGYLGYNKNYICGIFKKGTGLTIMDYLKLVRIERACELIEMSDYTFQQISLMVGFCSIHNFNKVFKRIIKMTPGAYKAKVNERNTVTQDTYKNEDNYDVV